MQGIHYKLCLINFHAREHLQYKRYLKALQTNNQLEYECFQNRFILGIANSELDYFPAYAIDAKEDIAELNIAISDGISLFEKMRL